MDPSRRRRVEAARSRWRPGLAVGVAGHVRYGPTRRVPRDRDRPGWLVHARARHEQWEEPIVKLTGLELRRIGLPLVSPFRTSFGTQTKRDVLLIRAVTPDSEGWGECVAMEDPLYSSEFVDGAQLVVRNYLAPRLFALEEISANHVAPALAAVRGHRMAKAALEIAILDAELRAAGMPLAQYLGAVRGAVDAGVSVGIMDSIPALVDAGTGYLAEGYRRVKLKIEPSWD